MVKICNKCGKEIEDQYDFCVYCGEKLPKHFICPDCTRRMCTAILTDDHCYVIYNNNKILFKLNTENANNAKLHYIDDRFYLAFEMNDGKKKRISDKL